MYALVISKEDYISAVKFLEGLTSLKDNDNRYINHNSLLNKKKRSHSKS